MTAHRRLAKLEGALSPKAATLLWLAEAHRFGSLPAYADGRSHRRRRAGPVRPASAMAQVCRRIADVHRAYCG
jgi:hypothetical protein